MCRVNSLFNMYNGLFLSTTVIHRTWLDKIYSNDYHFAKELISTLCSHGKYERVKCNTDKLLNITALNMTVTRLPANLASKKHNFPLRGIMCAWSNHSFYFLQSKKWLRRTYALRKKKKIQLSLAYIYLPPKTFNEALLDFRYAKWVQAWKPKD